MAAAVLPAGLSADPEQLLRTVLEESLAGTLLRPVLDATGEVSNFSYAYLNPAARRLLQVGAPPAGTLRAQYPPAAAASIRPLPGGLAVERQRRQWVQLFERATSAICLLRGPEWRYGYINPAYQALFPGRELLERPLLEARPELRGTPLEADFRHVCSTGQTFQRAGELVQLAATAGGPLQDYYFDLTCQAIHNEQDQIDGFVTYSTSVTGAGPPVYANYQRGANGHQRRTDVLQRGVELEQPAAHAGQRRPGYVRVYGLARPQGAHYQRGRVAQRPARSAAPRGAAANRGPLLACAARQYGGPLSANHYAAHRPHSLAAVVPGSGQAGGPRAAGAEVCQDLALATERAQAQLHLDVAPGLWVSFVPANLRSIVYNLVSNALKYRDPARPAQVWVRAERQPNCVILAVQDNDLGLTETQQRRLFKVLQRLRTHVEGTGVGLYMIKRLIENAGGTIAVESTPVVGSTFTVILPS